MPMPATSPTTSATTCGSFLCRFVVFHCLSVVRSLLADFGIVPIKRSTNEWLYDDVGTKFWVVSCMSWVLLDILELQRAQARKGKDAPTAEKLFELRAGLVSNLCNLLIGLYFLFPDRPITSPMAGVLGMISALIGLHARWR